MLAAVIAVTGAIIFSSPEHNLPQKHNLPQTENRSHKTTNFDVDYNDFIDFCINASSNALAKEDFLAKNINNTFGGEAKIFKIDVVEKEIQVTLEDWRGNDLCLMTIQFEITQINKIKALKKGDRVFFEGIFKQDGNEVYGLGQYIIKVSS